MADLQAPLGISTGSLHRAVADLQVRQWVDVTDIDKTRPGPPRKMLGTTELFKSDFQTTVEHASSQLNERGRGLFGQALDNCIAANTLIDGTEKDATRAAYLGRAVLLSEMYDLGDRGWFSGVEGWNSLIRIQAQSIVETWLSNNPSYTAIIS